MFRIWIYLSLNYFFNSLISRGEVKKKEKYIKKYISKQSIKKVSFLFSQCRVAFLFILKFLKINNNRNEIIFCAYNLPEMINIAVNLNLKIKFCDIDYQTGNMQIDQLKKKISKKTIAVVLTNMFNDYDHGKKIKKIVKKYNIPLIEDNAIYFGNFTKKENKKNYSGQIGDYSIYSFNIMKNISSFYGGAISTNNVEFEKFYNIEESKLKNFPKIPLLKQISIFLILKIMSINFLYKYIFIYIINFSYKNNIKFFLKLFYPSLKSIKKKFPNYYFSKISKISIITTYLQLKNELIRKKMFNLRKNNHKYYFKKISNIKSTKINVIKIKDINYQNFLDFPLLVKRKNELNDYLLTKGIEIRYKHYYNCEKKFSNNKNCINAEKYENELVCLPLHKKIKKPYIDFVAQNIENFLNK